MQKSSQMSVEAEHPEDIEPLEEEDLLVERWNITVDKGQEPLRIDKFLVNRIQNATRNKIQQATEDGLVLVNDQQVKSNYKIKPLDRIVVFSPQPAIDHSTIAEEIPLDVVYEDDDLMVVNKPAGMVVHPGCGNYTGTLVNGLAFYFGEGKTSRVDPTIPRFGLVHRIDKNTTGLLVIAKSEKAMNDLAKQFFDHTVRRRYVALVWGDFDQSTGMVNAHIGRHQRFRKKMDAYPDGDHGKDAITHFQVLEKFGYVTLLECRLETGRTHQIRVHMQHIGHPIFNDETYGGDRIVKGTVFSKYKQFVENCFSLLPRHALHARSLGFIHPITRKEMYFETDLPEDFKAVVEKWRQYQTVSH
ncbi:MAG: RluA family pseudouridine synthase [Chitinophagaceae bacterium]